MKKRERISGFVSGLAANPELSLDPHYTGYFTCFNAQQYYEAHDVLEQLWLQTQGDSHLYFKGLIQIAGAFVHLKKQFLRPTHPKDGRRMRPASRLFKLGTSNIESYGPRHMHLDVEGLCKLCKRLADQIIESDYRVNPWNPDHAPKLFLTPEGTE